MSTVLGSMLFVAGSLLFHPRFGVDLAYRVAVAAFIVGSALFAGAGAHALQTARQAWPRPAAATGTALFGLSGGLFFLLGSIALAPALGAYGILAGICLFQVGNCAYLAGSVWHLVEAAQRAPASRSECVSHGAYFSGALLFVCGGELVLREHGEAATLAWTLGSCGFLLGSSLQLGAQDLPHARVKNSTALTQAPPTS